MVTSTKLESHEVLRIANEDAKPKYVDLDDLSVTLRLCVDGWHVEYSPQPDLHGGGPHYVIDAADGSIISKKYYQ